MRMLRIDLAVLLCLWVTKPTLAVEPPASRPAEASGIQRLRDEAKAVKSFVHSKLAQEFVEAAWQMPHVTPRKIYRDDATRKTISEADYKKMAEEDRKKLREIAVDDTLYYYTKYGTPLAYCRPLEILSEAGFTSVKDKKIVDFGYGGVGHLRMLASLEAETIGIDVDPFLPAIYCDEHDQGLVHSKSKTGKPGRVTLLNGHWPADEKVHAAAGGSWDLFVSKNTLKNGYLHPARPVDKRMLVDLGVSDDKFVEDVFKNLKPGGYFMIYNICPAPAPADKPYIPWADGQCPFPREMLEKAGFKVLAFDKKDDEQVRIMAHLLGWDEGEGAMKLKDDLFAWYMLARKGGG